MLLLHYIRLQEKNDVAVCFLPCMKHLKGIQLTMSVVQTYICVFVRMHTIRWLDNTPYSPPFLLIPQASLIAVVLSVCLMACFLGLSSCMTVSLYYILCTCVCVCGSDCLLYSTSLLMVPVKAANGKPEHWDKEPACK